MIAIKFVAFMRIGCSCQLIIVILIQQVIVVFIFIDVVVIVVVVVTTPHGVVIVGSVVDYWGSMRGLSGYVPYGYDAVIIVKIVAVEFVLVGV